MIFVSKATLENAVRQSVVDAFKACAETTFDLDMSKADTGPGEFMLPLVDAEGNEMFVVVKATVKRGTRNGDGGYTGYDGYAAAEDWAMTLADRKAAEEARKEKATREAAEKQRKKDAKKVVKKLNKVGLDAMIHEPPEVLDKELNTMY